MARHVAPGRTRKQSAGTSILLRLRLAGILECMTYQFDGYNYIVRLERGEPLVEKLTAFVIDQHIAGGWVSAIGGVEWVELGYYHIDTKKYEWRRFDQVLEITSLQGTIAWVDDAPALHLHGSFSDESI
jgi:uncharacterized protein